MSETPSILRLPRIVFEIQGLRGTIFVHRDSIAPSNVLIVHFLNDRVREASQRTLARIDVLEHDEDTIFKLCADAMRALRKRNGFSDWELHEPSYSDVKRLTLAVRMIALS